MSDSSAPPTDPAVSARLVTGLEAIIDAATGVLAAQSLPDTLQGMADALSEIVPYTSLAVYEVDWSDRTLIPLLASGRYVEQTLRSRPPLDDSITGSAVLRGDVVCLAPGDPLMREHVMPGTPQSDLEAILVAPLHVAESIVGTLNVWREDDDPWFMPEEAMLLRRFASLAAMAYANSAQREQLRTQALTDDLTGLFNRRHFEHSLSGVLHEERPRGGPTSVVYFDIDAFKSINDSFGHAAGDRALRHFAEVLAAQTRAGDVACRTGGEEFCLILPQTSREQAWQMADRVVRAVRVAGLGPRGNLTVSAGVATSPRSRHDRERLVRSADEHLMRAKRDGRDRVVVAAAMRP
jgi:diguanylate cyclase (GGDEF)-like protein